MVKRAHEAQSSRLQDVLRVADGVEGAPDHARERAPAKGGFRWGVQKGSLQKRYVGTMKGSSLGLYIRYVIRFM